MRTFKIRKCKRVHDIYFSLDGTKLLAVGGTEVQMIGTAVWLDLATGENTERIDQWCWNHAVTPDSRRLFLLGANGAPQWGGISAVQWTATPGPPEWHAFPGSTEPDPVFNDIVSMAFDGTGEYIAARTGRKHFGLLAPPDRVLLLESEGARILKQFPIERDLRILALDDSASRVALTGGFDFDPDVCLLETFSGKLIYRFTPPSTVSRSVLFTPDGRLVAANGRNVFVLPPDQPVPLFVLQGHKGQVNAIALTHDGRKLLSASHDGAIRVWDMVNGRPISAYEWNFGPITAVKFSRDGLTCAAAAVGGTVIVWDVDD